MNEQHVAWAPWSGPGHEHLVPREATREPRVDSGGLVLEYSGLFRRIPSR